MSCSPGSSHSKWGDVRAINFSFGEPLSRDPRDQPRLDGDALLTQCIDWSSRVHQTLYVVAGNQGMGGIPIPTDNFNGINVAYSRRVEGVFRKIDFANLGSEPTLRSPRSPGTETNEGPRRSINLVAPGSQITLIDPDGHVVGTVALLQQLVDRQLRAGVEHSSLEGRHPLVMKAVLLNSADKLEDEGDGQRLGMGRTLLDAYNRNWIDSDAYRDRAIPLHQDLGTGHLNQIEVVGEQTSNVAVRDFRLPAAVSRKVLRSVPGPLVKFSVRQISPRPVVKHKNCTACRACEKACPAGAIKVNDKTAAIEYAKCVRCMCCHEVCRYQAITPRRPFLGHLVYGAIRGVQKIIGK